MPAPTDTKPTLSKAEEKDLNYLAKQAHVPVAEVKKVPEAPVVKPQDEFNQKLKELSKTVLELAEGGGDIRNDAILRVVVRTLKHAHMCGYAGLDVPFSPFASIV